MTKYAKKTANMKLVELNDDELRTMLSKLVNGRIPVSDNTRRTNIRAIKKQLDARKRAEQTLLGEDPIGYGKANGYRNRPPTLAYLNPAQPSEVLDMNTIRRSARVQPNQLSRDQWATKITQTS